MLRMASEELELWQQIAEAKAEEKTSAQFDEEQVIDGRNDYLKNVRATLTSIPILSEAQPNGQSKGAFCEIPKFSSCQHRFNDHFCYHTHLSQCCWYEPNCPIQGNFPLKKKKLKTMRLPLIPSYIMTISKDVCTFTERIEGL